MLSKIIMPSGGQTTDESMIVKWYKKIGDQVKKGDVIFEIETDKAVMEIESFAEGTLLEVKYPEGEYAATGETVAIIGEADEKLPSDFAISSVKEDDEYQPIVKKEIEIKQEEKPVLASPFARQLARNMKLDINEIVKSTSIQPVKKIDVENYIKKNNKLEQELEDFYLIKTTPMRKIIAKRMLESISTIPHYNVSMEVDMNRAIEVRQLLNDHVKSSGLKISFNDIIIKCVSKAIEMHPIINSTYGEDEIKVYKNVNFGLAVGLENGLVVPVLRNANQKSIRVIAEENLENIGKAKKNQLQPSDMTGGTITLSNLGMYGVNCFTAIINQPESCILAIGSIIEKPVVLKGEIVPRHRMNITATYDHRVIDGAVGADFLKDVKALLEKPELLLL